MGTDTATLAVIQIGDEVALHLMDAAIRAKYLAKTALDTLVVIDNRYKRPPGP